MLTADYKQHKLLPESEFTDIRPPEPFIPNSIGHHAKWLAACKTGSPTACHFGHVSMLTECVVVGDVAYRSGRKIEWDSKNLRATGVPDADQFIRREYRRGWTL
jgi:hypothetical protein